MAYALLSPQKLRLFIHDLPLKKFQGLAKSRRKNSKACNLETLGDLQEIEEALLVQHFGKYGKQLFLYAQGIDERLVQAERERQQISKETTFDDDRTLAQCLPYWPLLIDQVWRSLERKQLNARGVSAKLKLKNFQRLQHSKSL